MKRPVVRCVCLGAVVSLLVAGSVAEAQRNYYVVNGQRGTAADLRATVALAGPDGEQFCTGTLVTDRVVMTAAHCVATEWMDDFLGPEEFRVVVGRLDVRDATANLTSAYPVEGVYPSCGFLENDSEGPGPNDETSFGRSDDVAFLRLATPIPPSVMTPVAILPEARRAAVSIGAEVRVTGYGINDDFTGEGGELYTGVTEIVRLNEWEFSSTRDPRGMSTDSCNGDSGGPVYIDDGGAVFVAGVVSRGNADSEFNCGDGGIYPIATSYLDLFQTASDGAVPVVCMGGGGTGPGTDPGWGGELDAILADTCELDCCGGSPNEGHPLCGVCPTGTIPSTCADPTDTIAAEELDDLQAEICTDCASGALTHRACWVCASDAPDAGGGAPDGGIFVPDPGADAGPGEAPAGGCGCTVGGSQPRGALGAMMLVGLGLLVVRRRRS